MKLVLAAAALAALALPATAQFDLFKWHQVPGGTASTATVAAGSMFVAGGFQDPAGFQGYTAVAPVAGTVAFKLQSYLDFDGLCNASVPAFSLNGSLTQLASCSTGNESFAFEVQAGSEFGLGLQTLIPTWPGVVTYTNFSFTPAVPFDYWTDLGQGMGGTLGAPVLAGQGLLHAGMPIKLSVSNAVPHVPATLVIGLGALNAPFKGGVMVPSPDVLISGLLIGMQTLDLTGLWPASIPAGFQFYLQVWIADPTAPLGLSATNGLRAATP